MASDDDFFAQLEALILESASEFSTSSPAEVLTQVGASTASIAVLDRGVITSHCITSGKSNTSTLFQACSVSKPTTAMALMKIIGEGHLSLSTKILSVLPDHIVKHLTRDSRTAPAVETITIQHLISHRGGISIHGFPGYADKTKVPSIEDVVLGKGNTGPIELITLPGLEVMYSGGGTSLIQIAMEHVLKKSYAQIMQEYVLGPLEMTSSCFVLPEGETNVERCFWNGTYPTDAPWNTLPEQAAGGLWTTPTDLLKLVRAMQASLAGDTGSFMDQKSAIEMSTCLKDSAAVGWFVDDTKFAHSGGNSPGWTCYVFGYADLTQNIRDEDKEKGFDRNVPEGCGIAVMTNSWNGIPVIDKVINAIAYLKGWPDCHLPVGGTGRKISFRAPEGVIIDHGWKDWLDPKWADEWELVDNAGSPAIKIKDVSTLIALKPAAVPARTFEDGRKSIDLIFDGFQLMLRLTWEGDERVVELWNGGTDARKTLKASSRSDTARDKIAVANTSSENSS